MTEHTYAGLVRLIVDIISSGLVPLILGLATIVFLWGVANYVLKAEDAGTRAKGRKFMLYGLIGLLVGISLWSIVAVFLDVLGVPPIVPQIR